MHRTILHLLVCAVLFASVGQPASALLVSGNQLYTSANETVYAMFIGSPLTKTNVSFGNSPTPTMLFNENTATYGRTINLGTFATGTMLKLELEGDEHTGLCPVRYTGPAGANADYMIRAIFTPLATYYYLHWEDCAATDPLNDFDYEEHVIALVGIENPDDTVVPEPATLGLVGLGLSLAGFMRKQRGSFKA